MTEQKTLTFMEAIAEARKGAVIKRIAEYSHELIFYRGVLSVKGRTEVSIFVAEELLDAKYIIVTPAPKPKVKVALYAYHYGDRPFPELSTFYYKDDKIFSGAFIGKGVKWFKRLDWSEMEVDE